MLIIFDCDGVLVDSEIIACRVDAIELSRLGFQVTPADIARRFVGSSTAAMLETLSVEQGIAVPDGFRDHLRESVHAAFAGELQPIPGIRDTVQALDHPYCVASNSDLERIEKSLELTGLLAIFSPHLFSAEMVPNGKPAPDLYQHAAAAMGTDSAHCLVIEDSTTGVRAGVAAGMTVIGFTGGTHCANGHGEQLRAYGAIDVAATMADLRALLASTLAS